MNVHFFYSNKSHENFYDVRLKAYMEQDVYSSRNQRMEQRFTYIEEIRLHVCKELSRHHVASFKIDFGKDSCHGSGYSSFTELMREHNKWSYDNGWESVTEKNYLRLRKVVLAIYNRVPAMDFSLVAEPQTSFIRELF